MSNSKGSTRTKKSSLKSVKTEKTEPKSLIKPWYIGTEVEGRWAGFKTLFIQGNDLPTGRQLMWLITDQHIAHVYIGVKGERIQWNPEIVEHIEELLTLNTCFTLEMSPFDLKYLPAFAAHNPKVRIIVSFFDNSIARFFNDSMELKVDGDTQTVIFTKTQTIDTTYLDDSKQISLNAIDHVYPEVTRSLSGRDHESL